MTRAAMSLDNLAIAERAARVETAGIPATVALAAQRGLEAAVVRAAAAVHSEISGRRRWRRIVVRRTEGDQVSQLARLEEGDR